MVSPDFERRSLDARFLCGLAVKKLDVKPPALGPADVHPEQHLRPILGIGPSGSGIDGDDRVLGIVFSGEEPLQFELLELAFQTVQMFAEVVDDVFALPDPFGQRLDLVHRPREGRAPLQTPGHACPAP